MAFVKIGVLLIKTLSKPVAKSLKSRVTKYPILEDACQSVGQLSHRFMSNLTIMAAGHRRVNVKPLDDKRALQEGTEIVSEAFVFSVACTTVGLERTFAYYSNLKKEAKARIKHDAIEKRHKDEVQMTHDRLDQLEEKNRALEEAVSILKQSQKRWLF